MKFTLSLFSAFEFIRNLLTLLLQHELDPNVRLAKRTFLVQM
jgi:hypothetical protein